MLFDLEKLNLLYYTFDNENKTFLRKDYKSDFYISKELLEISELLNQKKINYIVDKDHNIILSQKN